MSDLVMRAAELIGAIIKQRVDEDTSGLREQLLKARHALSVQAQHADLVSATLEVVRDELGAGAEFATDAARRVVKERDAARAELADVAAQRDAHLSRSVELATRVTELEAKTFDVARLEQDNAALRSALASERRKAFDMRAAMDALEERLAGLTPAAVVGLDAHVSCVSGVFEGRSGIVDKVYGSEVRVRCADHFTFVTERTHLVATPALVEVDGFRVGDLVRHRALGSSNREIVRFERTNGVNYAHFDAHTGGWQVGNLARKPVEVGDTVRCISGAFNGRVGRVDTFWGGGVRVQEGGPGGGYFTTAADTLFAVAP